MDFTRSRSTISRVGEDLDLVEEIFLRLASMESLIRYSILNNSWYATLKEPVFLSRYMKKNRHHVEDFLFPIIGCLRLVIGYMSLNIHLKMKHL